MKRIISSLALCLTLVCLAAAVYGSADRPQAQAHSLSGNWKCMSHGGTQGNMAFTLDLEQSGTTVTGSVSSPLGDADIAKATFKDDTLHIEIDGGDSQYLLTAKYKDGMLTGSWSSTEGEKGTWEGQKASPRAN